MLPEEVRLREVLLVEDNRADVRLLQEGFRETGTQCILHVVEDGEQALDYLFRRGPHRRAARPDLILLDLNLPRKNGTDVLRTIKADHDLSTIPVVVLTSSRSERDILLAYRNGANSYLQKRNSLEELYDMVSGLRKYWLELAVLPDDQEQHAGA